MTCEPEEAELNQRRYCGSRRRTHREHTNKTVNIKKKINQLKVTVGSQCGGLLMWCGGLFEGKKNIKRLKGLCPSLQFSFIDHVCFYAITMFIIIIIITV